MMPAQQAALAAEIANDPEAKDYAAHLPDSPGIVVELLNAQTETMTKPLTAAKALTWAASGPMSAIVDASTNAAHPARASCLAFLHALKSGMELGMPLPEIQAAFAGWAQAGVITQEQHDSLMATALQSASRAEVLGLGRVTESDLIVTGVV